MAAPGLDVEPAEYMLQSSAERPAEYKRLVQAVLNGLLSGCYRLAFYNIGWNVASKKPRHTADGLAEEICKMVRDKCADAVGSSEVFNRGLPHCPVLNGRSDAESA